uniref:PDEase domain-containing protein n=1 Tax=Heterorhabditis bacteriophora TaxID=37862 RepID=A0A1I7W5Y3_HETBA
MPPTTPGSMIEEDMKIPGERSLDLMQLGFSFDEVKQFPLEKWAIVVLPTLFKNTNKWVKYNRKELNALRGEEETGDGELSHQDE